MHSVKARNLRRIWIAWETQRRTITLSERVRAELHILDLEHLGWWRYPLSLFRTARLLLGNRGGVVFVQNPSMVLAVFAGFCKRLFGYTLVVDRHSNFLQGTEYIRAWKRCILLWMSRYSLRKADLTIVTNSDVEGRFVRGIGTGFILPDPYPDLPFPDRPHRPGTGELRVLFVSSWETDEPILEVMEVCRLLGERIKVFISGRMKESYASAVEAKPDNFILTGFLTDAAYFELMESVDCVLAVTRWPGTLCCGAYEGVAMGKPLILNNEQVTKDYFSAGARYTSTSVSDLRTQLSYVADHREEMAVDVRRFYRASSKAWLERLDALNARIEQLHSGVS